MKGKDYDKQKTWMEQHSLRVEGGQFGDREDRTKVDFLPHLALVSYHFRDKTSGVSQAETP